MVDKNYIPSDSAAEEALLSILLTSPQDVIEVISDLQPSEFSVHALGEIYRAMQDCDRLGKAVDKVTVADRLRKNKMLTKVGGVAELERLIERSDPPSSLLHYMEIIKEKAILRRLVDVGKEVYSSASRPDADAPVEIEKAEQLIFEATSTHSQDSLVSMVQAVSITLTSIERARGSVLVGHSSGFEALDKKTSGFKPDELIILAARPAMGKSALALQMARHIAETTGLYVPFFSYEMDTTSLITRLFATSLRENFIALSSGSIRKEVEAKLNQYARHLSEIPLMIDDRPPPSVAGIRSSVRRLARKGKIGAIFIDYLQLIKGDRKYSGDNRNVEVGDISRDIRALAKELQVPVIALSQLSRGVESRVNKRPLLSDLRDSGGIEQDASLVMFLYRGSVYADTVPPTEAELIIAKQRNGPTGKIPLHWDEKCASFFSIAGTRDYDGDPY